MIEHRPRPPPAADQPAVAPRHERDPVRYLPVSPGRLAYPPTRPRVRLD
ncbi:MAG: hypothetical protein WCG47_07480 [Dermatophilaceae bacterium]